MLLKIKLERNCDPYVANELHGMTSPFIELDNDCSAREIKHKIKDFVQIPEANMEIRTLSRVLDSAEKVRGNWDAKSSQPRLLMLYKKEDDTCEPEFFCFLQLHTDESADKYKQFEQRLQSGQFKTPTLALDTIVVDENDHTDESSETDSETESSTSDDSGSDSDYSRQRKRRHAERKQEGISLSSEISPHTRACLEEFPKYKKIKETDDAEEPYESDSQIATSEVARSVQKTSTPLSDDSISESGFSVAQTKPSAASDSIYSTASSTAGLLEHNSRTESSSLGRGTYSDTSNSNDISVSAILSGSSYEQNNMSTTTTSPNTAETSALRSEIESSTNSFNAPETHNLSEPIVVQKPPSMYVQPEQRKFIGILTRKDSKGMNARECEDLLNAFFEQFTCTTSSRHLIFDEVVAIELYDEHIWIACADKITFDWISSSIPNISKSYTFCGLEKFYKLRKCSVVIPSVRKTQNLLSDVFDLMEKQNPNSNTALWVVHERKRIDNPSVQLKDRLISKLCPNDIISLSIDEVSLTQLKISNLKLKYGFWKVHFIME